MLTSDVSAAICDRIVRVLVAGRAEGWYIHAVRMSHHAQLPLRFCRRVPINFLGEQTGNPIQWTVAYSMNQREPTTAPQGVGQALPCLALLLLPLLMAQRAWSRPVRLPVGNIGQISQPYLSAIGAPLLRFAEAAPPPDLAGRPAAAGGPPHPAAAEEPETDTSIANPQRRKTGVTPPARADVMIEPTPNPPGTIAEPARKPAPGSTDAPAPETRTPPPILQDELHPQARPEDFLPFFQIPSTHSGDNSTVAEPRTPAPLPPSSATYTQTPR